MSPTFFSFFWGGGGQAWLGTGPVHGPRTKAVIASFGFAYFPFISFTANKGYMSTGILFPQKWWNQIFDGHFCDSCFTKHFVTSTRINFEISYHCFVNSQILLKQTAAAVV